jgi:hypothetical protein
MRIVTDSDLHREFGWAWVLPADLYGDVMILAGDIITFKDYAPLDHLRGIGKSPSSMWRETTNGPLPNGA